MGSRWLREIPGSYYNYKYWTGGFWRKAIPFFLHHVLGYTLQSETAAGGKSFISYQKTGVGDVTGSGFNFIRTSGNDFASTDVDSWLFIRDDVNPRNGGAYKIAAFTDTNNITIDFAGGPTEFPTTSTGVNWWIISDSFQVPSTAGDVVSLQSRHSTGWAIRLTVSSTYTSLSVQVCVDGNWAGGKILGVTNPPGMWIGDYASNVYTVEGDYDGEWLNMITTLVEYDGTNVSGKSVMVSVARIEPVETGHNTLELTTLNGGNGGREWYLLSRQTQVATGYNDYWGVGRVWDVAANAQRYIFPIDLSIGGFVNTGECMRFPRIAQTNRRLGGKLEVRYGTYFIMDQNNTDGKYQLYGRVSGHWTIPCSFESVSFQGWNHDSTVVNQRRQKRFFPCTWHTNKDFLVLENGFMIPWPGVGPSRVWY